mmetsp:Transcript_27399/g.69716  ORF Transcript_27399/g.69716 Transcript_27399/m.69716 type:complete len:305 (+) Transcript_27399:14-928(+)
MQAALPLLSIAVATPLCGRTLVDNKGLEWRFNLTNLTVSHDFEVSTHRGKLALAVCKPPQAVCRMQGSRMVDQVPPSTATSIITTGSAPNVRCQKFGWGALGTRGSHWSLIDPGGANEGVRLTHYDLTLATSDVLSNASGKAVADEWGAARPPALIVDFVCEPKAPLPSAPLEEIAQPGVTPIDVMLRLKTPAACPIINPCSVPGGTTVNRAVVDAALKAASAAHEPSNTSNPFVTFLGIIAGIAVLALMVVWFAPLSIKRSLRAERLMPTWPTPWPAAAEPRWQGVSGEADGEYDGRSAYRAI